MKIYERQYIESIDQDALRELDLYLENTSELYSQKMSIIQNIQRKIKSGKYDPRLAPKLWMYWVDEGARRYIKEFGSPRDRMEMLFPKPLRMALAGQYAEEYYQAIMNGEYD